MAFKLENHIIRQLKLLDIIYYYSRNDLSIEGMADELDISLATVRRDLSDMRLWDRRGYVNTSIDRETRVLTYNRIIESSLMFRLFRALLYSPGHRSEYYCDKVTTSRANFYKYISALGREIKNYGGSIIANDGYYIVASDEIKFRYFLFHHFFIYTNVELSKLSDSSDYFLEKMLRRNGFQLTFCEHSSIVETKYHLALFWTILIRRNTMERLMPGSKENSDLWDVTPKDCYDIRQLGLVVNESTIKSALSEFSQDIELKADAVEKEPIKAAFTAYLEAVNITLDRAQHEAVINQLHRIINVLYQLYLRVPDDVRGTSISLSDFLHEYKLINEEVLSNFYVLRDKVNTVLDTHFEYCDEVFFYWTTLYIGDYIYLPQKKILFVNKKLDYYSVYLSEEAKKLMETFKISPIFTFADESNYEAMIYSGEYDLIISDFMIDKKFNYGSIVYNNNALMYERIIEYVRTVLSLSRK